MYSLESVLSGINRNIGASLSDIIITNDKDFEIITTPRMLINDYKITVDDNILGSIIGNRAEIYETLTTTMVLYEISCTVNGRDIIFPFIEGINGKYAIVSYLTNKT